MEYFITLINRCLKINGIFEAAALLLYRKMFLLLDSTKCLKNSFVSLLTLIILSASASNHDSLYRHSIRLQHFNTDSAKNNFIRCLPYYKSKGDSVVIIDIKLRLITIYSGQGEYQKAYDMAWSLLPLVNNSRFVEERIALNRNLASLYIIFGEYKKAHLYLEESIEITAELKDSMKKHTWLSKIYGQKAWLITNERFSFEESKSLLIKALEENSKLDYEHGHIYLSMQLAELYIMHDSIRTAQNILTKIELQTQNKYKDSHSLLFDHFGQLYMKKERYDSAVYYFDKCIKTIDTYKNHIDNKVEILDSLASCHHYLGNNDLAFHYSRQSLKVSNALFGNKSTMNKALFEIKDGYQEQLEAQKLKLLQHEKKELRLKTVIYTSILLSIIIALIVRSKMHAKKQRIEQQQSEDEMENRNKELMTSALQLIERDSLLNYIGKSLTSLEFETGNQIVIKDLVSNINANKAQKWNEFELYFTRVNKDFYTILKSSSPTLSATDLKMCALIKLGFSSKDMADIMGIETDSVNTSRSRIRKKMNLSRDVNLIEHLRSLE